jgi:hypothetical protein
MAVGSLREATRVAEAERAPAEIDLMRMPTFDQPLDAVDGQSRSSFTKAAKTMCHRMTSIRKAR